MLHDFIRLYIRNAPALLVDLQTAIASHDAARHQFEPSRIASLLGYFRATEACVAAARRNGLTAAERAYARLEQEIAMRNRALAEG